MVIFKSVPFRLGHDLVWSRRVDYNLVAVDFSDETMAVILSHLILLRLDQIVSLAKCIVNELLGVRRVTDTLEELDTLFSL